MFTDTRVLQVCSDRTHPGSHSCSQAYPLPGSVRSSRLNSVSHGGTGTSEISLGGENPGPSGHAGLPRALGGPEGLRSGHTLPVRPLPSARRPREPGAPTGDPTRTSLPCVPPPVLSGGGSGLTPDAGLTWDLACPSHTHLTSFPHFISFFHCCVSPLTLSRPRPGPRGLRPASRSSVPRWPGARAEHPAGGGSSWCPLGSGVCGDGSAPPKVVAVTAST